MEITIGTRNLNQQEFYSSNSKSDEKSLCRYHVAAEKSESSITLFTCKVATDFSGCVIETWLSNQFCWSSRPLLL